MSNTKTFFDNEATLRLDDKSFVLTKGMGEDYKANYSSLIDTLKADLIRPLLKSMIGKLHTNTSNKTRDSKKLNDEYFEYLLLDGRELLVADYPELVDFLDAVKTQGTFRLPDFRDGTLRNIEAGSGRALCSFQEDAMQPIYGASTAQFLQSNVGGQGVNGAIDCHKIGNIGVAAGHSSFEVSAFNFYSQRVVRTAEETRMKNVGVQFYIIAKVLI